MSLVVILGSSFERPMLGGKSLMPSEIVTSLGNVALYRYPGFREAYVLFRHGIPHTYLPNQIPYLANALALGEVGCEALLVTSSVGVLDPKIPLNVPLLVGDLLMLENRLPDGRACTVFQAPGKGQGHLVLEEGLFSRDLTAQVARFSADEKAPAGGPVVFAYVGGPRTKTAFENRCLATLGAQVNSMTLGPEVVLANELEIPTAALVVGHKYSGSAGSRVSGEKDVARSLEEARAVLERIVIRFLEGASAPRFANHVYRFKDADE